MKIAIGCDHRGLSLKQQVTKNITEMGHTFKDYGCFSTDSVDYPDIALPVAEVVAKGEYDRGILICGSGIGMSIAANKVKGIRAVLCCDAFSARRARQHNDANIICLGADREQQQSLREILEIFLTTPFEGGRHQRRLAKIKEMEKG